MYNLFMIFDVEIFEVERIRKIVEATTCMLAIAAVYS